ncbi:hypothetical protein [Polyangium mundeleinium]|uniref:Uncharacterized protein n=1 Tax=Polyangium mundeleinium TaxID=2995306 RepID=A0ABT5EMT4_9BACT|nr:hypothetical protein [Polyangium mundeleinium]MDC0743150.1 hypothetical protein [Polyangium mundeleinium]
MQIFAILFDCGAFSGEPVDVACDARYVARFAAANAIYAEGRFAVRAREASLPLRAWRAMCAATIHIRLVAIHEPVVTTLAGIIEAVPIHAAMLVHQTLDTLPCAIAEARCANIARRLRQAIAW